MNAVSAREIAGFEIEKEQPSLTYRLDLNKGRIAEMIDGEEAVKQAVGKALITKRYKNLIYDSQYGSEIAGIIGAKDASDNLKKSEIEYYIEDALSADARFLKIEKADLETGDNYADIFLTVSTVFGEVSGEVSVNV